MKTLANVLVVVAMIGWLTGCGGSSSNASPGSVVVEVPVDGGGGGGTGGGGGGGGGGTGGGGPTNPSTIPASLNTVITDSGDTGTAAFNDLPIFTIDVTQLTNGQLDPAGLVIGNDAIYQISGGALRVTPPAGTVSNGKNVTLEDGSGTASANGPLPECQLVLEPGAIVVGETETEFLVIEQGCALVADGTEDQPIIFTAKAEVEGTVEDGDRGLWGGVVINGLAPINDCPEGAVGGTAECTKEGEANSGLFGGADPEDNSGIVRYVSVRYAGSNVDPQNQLNGIAFQAVGSDTIVEYVQVHNNLDDGIEFFGGTVDAKYVVLTGNDDDSLDWTDGWTGRIQYLYIEQTDGGDNAIEADNRSDDENVEPRSNPTIANMTVIGKSDENALRFRAGTAVSVYNSFVDGSASCIRVNGVSRDFFGAATDPISTIAGVSFACASTHRDDDDGAIANYLAGATNVSSNGERVDPVEVPEVGGDDFFEDTEYLGAFGPENWADGWTLAGSVSQPTQPDFGCPDGTTTSSRVINDQRVCQLSGTVTQDLLLTSNNVYELVGKVTIGGDNENSADLVIQAGTTVFGGTDVDFLVISRGSRIVANGSRTAPITFTHISDVDGTINVEEDPRGLWGGVVINGNAPINDCPEGATGGTAGCTKEGEANSGLFGGDQPNDDSGKLNYVVVKYAGSNVDPQNQLNGIAFQGVGDATEVDFVQVHNNLDDGIEFFGGTVNARHIVLTGNGDDSLDWTDGWVGQIQYLIIDQTPGAGDSGIEADNRSDDEAVLPRSLPKIANMSINGNAGSRAIRLRAGTGLELYNSVVQGNDRCLVVEGAESLGQLGTGIQFGGVSFDCVDALDAQVQAELDVSENVTTNGTAVAAVDLSDDEFFDPTNYIGAIENEDEDWTTGWAFGMPDASASFGCPAGTTATTLTDGSAACELQGTYTADLALTRDNVYVLEGPVAIGGDNTDSAVLDIQSGTVVVGDDPEDFLIISRGSQIWARGSRNAPVTFTAEADILGTIANPTTEQGLWGGVVINGNAPINDCPEGETGGTVGCTKEGEANSGTFGGATADDSSGLLNYVVVKYAGSNVDPQNQLNGIAFQGVGSGTEVEYIQVFNNLDDGVEFFGGTVSAKYVVLVGNADDSLDWTDGWTGSIQYLHIEQLPDSGDNGIEADNRSDDPGVAPISDPTIANMTIVGRAEDRAIRLRAGTAVDIYNSEVSGSGTCLEVNTPESLAFLGDGTTTFNAVGLGCTTIIGNTDAGEVQTVQDFLDADTNGTQDGSAPTPVTLPGDLDPAGNSVIGSDINEWGQDWTVGVSALSGS